MQIIQGGDSKFDSCSSAPPMMGLGGPRCTCLGLTFEDSLHFIQDVDEGMDFFEWHTVMIVGIMWSVMARKA